MLWNRHIYFTWLYFLRAILDGVQGWTPELLRPVAENPNGSTRKNNSAHVLYFIEKYDTHLQLSQSLLEDRHSEFWTPNVQHLVRKPIIITFEKFWQCHLKKTSFYKREMVKHMLHILYRRNVVCHNCSIDVICFQKKFRTSCNHVSLPHFPA